MHFGTYTADKCIISWGQKIKVQGHGAMMVE